MHRTKIETTEFVWTPASGCEGIGCAVKPVCWASRQVKRLGQFCSKCPSFIPHMHLDRLNEPLQAKKPHKIFPVSTGDLFGLQSDQTKLILDVMEQAYWHTFQPLTKQPQNALPFSPFPENTWFGVSVNCQADVWRLDILRKIRARIKFGYFEPLYSGIDYDLSFLDWIVIGAQTRPNKQPKAEWVKELLYQAERNKTPVFLKNNLSWETRLQEFPDLKEAA